MERIGAGLESNGDGASAEPVFRAEGGSLNLEFLDHVHRWVNASRIKPLAPVLHAIERVVRLSPTPTIYTVITSIQPSIGNGSLSPDNQGLFVAMSKSVVNG